MIITAIIFIIYLLVTILGCQCTIDSDYFFSKNYSTVIKGLCCIIVIFVHIPNKYGNKLQDTIGSFAYVCVTLFFMLSAYGLKWSMKNKKDYIKNFIRNRICALMIPYFIILLLRYICGFITGISGAEFVLVLLMFYIVFYISYKYINKKYQDIVICIYVLGYSLIGRLCNIGISWYPESLGFMYGIIFANIINIFKAKASKHNINKIIILFLASIILGISYLKFKYIWFVGDYILKVILGITIILFLFVFTIYIKIGNKISRYLGKISYEIFLVHIFVINVFNRMNLNISSGIYIILIISITMILASILNIIDVTIINKIRISNNKTDKFNPLKKSIIMK